MMTTVQSINIGGASGYWGDSNISTSQLLQYPNLDFLVYDYLAEITMSIMARAKLKDPTKGYAGDFVHTAMGKNLDQIAQRGIKVLSNAGGVNPAQCALALEKIIREQNLALKVAYIEGDDLIERKEELAEQGMQEMFSNAAFPDVEKVKSINAYLGAVPIVKALHQGADIVITGRCVDSAVTLAACLFSFGWDIDEYDKLSSASLAGHILECGAQATGGNFTDWQEIIATADTIGYPIANIQHDGAFLITKLEGTGGKVNRGTVVEQMLYEIGDPQNYMLPDVICDFSQVRLEQVAPDLVRVTGARGYAPTNHYKVCSTFMDGYRAGTNLSFVGPNSHLKGEMFAQAVLKRVRASLKRSNLPDFEEVSIENIGFESQYGNRSTLNSSREIVTKIAVKNEDPAPIGMLLKELTGMGLSAPPGLSGFAGGRSKPSPVYKLFSFLYPKDQCSVSVKMLGETIPVSIPIPAIVSHNITAPLAPDRIDLNGCIEVPLIKLAWGRSGDKGNHANIGIASRKPEYYPYIVEQLSSELIASAFQHFLENPDATSIEKYLLPGSNAVNFLLKNVLGGGGVSSLRNDAQGKAYAQIILDLPIKIKAELVE